MSYFDAMYREIAATTLANPAQWFVDALTGGSRNSAGVKVTYQSALRVAYCWAAQQIIAGDVASLPFDVKRREPDDDLVLDRRHYAWKLLNRDANPNLSSYTLRETLTHWALLFGDGMAYVYRDSMGRPIELIPAVPGDLVPKMLDGMLVYHNAKLDITLPASEVLHIRGLGDDMSGHGVLSVGKEVLGLAISQDKYGSNSWKNSNLPKVVLKHPKVLSKESADTLREQFAEKMQDPEKPAVASGGLEIESFPVNNSDAQWVESRKQTIVDVAALYNLPPHKLGDSTRVGYNGVEAENRAYITQCLRRWLRRWESEVERKLLPRIDYEQSRVVCVHDPKPLIDTDTQAITTELVQQLQAGIVTVNEARQRLGYPRRDDGDGNVTTTETPTPELPVVNRATFVALVADRLDRLAQTITGQAEARIKKGLEFDDTWASTWSERTTSYVGTALDATSQVFTTTMAVDRIASTVEEWAVAAASGAVLVPSPEDFAEQIVGA